MGRVLHDAGGTVVQSHLNVATTCLQAAGSGSRMDAWVCESEKRLHRNMKRMKDGGLM